jgi:hypothetical protein
MNTVSRTHHHDSGAPAPRHALPPVLDEAANRITEKTVDAAGGVARLLINPAQALGLDKPAPSA